MTAGGNDARRDVAIREVLDNGMTGVEIIGTCDGGLDLPNEGGGGALVVSEADGVGRVVEGGRVGANADVDDERVVAPHPAMKTIVARPTANAAIFLRTGSPPFFKTSLGA